MIKRREFLIAASISAIGSTVTVPRFAFESTSKPDPQTALVMDSMGELRPTYSKELLNEVIASGLNAIAVTVCDPKTFEREAVKAANDGIGDYDRFIRNNSELLIKGSGTSDVDKAKTQGKIAVFYLFQNSTPLGRDLDTVDLYYDMAVRSVQITYNYQNWAGAGCKEKNGSGLTRFGYEMVEKLNEKNMLVDLSHANMKTMSDAIGASKKPVIVSHTACMAVYENIRNTTDENMRLLADRGGVVGICQIRPFVTDTRKGAFEHYLNHIQHAVKVAGIQHVCIGSDRDHRVIRMTDEYLAELKAEEGENFNEKDWPLYMDKLNGPRRMETIWDGLAKRKFSDSQIEQIMGKKLFRLYGEVL